MLEANLTGQVLGCFYPVYNDLGFGFSEPVYSNSMCVELQSPGIATKREVLTEVLYRGVVVGKSISVPSPPLVG
ncbi:MAG: GxxExxY protein [Gemmatimonadaceae bacterium]